MLKIAQKKKMEGKKDQENINGSVWNLNLNIAVFVYLCNFQIFHSGYAFHDQMLTGWFLNVRFLPFVYKKLCLKTIKKKKKQIWRQK